MTADNVVPVRRGTPRLHEWLTRSIHDLAPAIVAELVERLPVYSTLPPEQLRRDIVQVVQRALRGFAAFVRDGGPPDSGDLAALRESAIRRAEEGVPLDAVLGAYFVGARYLVDAFLREVDHHEDPTAVAQLPGQLLTLLQPVTAAVLDGYLRVAQASWSADRDAEQTLLNALLDGKPAGEAAARAGVALPPGYLVLSVAVGRHPDETAPGVDPLIAARRKVRRLRAELRHQTRGTALVTLAADGGLVLLPMPVPADALTAAHWRDLADLVDRLSRQCGVTLTVGAAEAESDGVPDAARLAAEVRQVASTAGRGPGVHRLSDVLLEYQLSRPGAAHAQLAALLRPVAERPDLLDTLQAFLRCALDRRETAARLQVHPNTVDYRLRRVTALTGLDTGRSHDLLLLHAALAALGRPPGHRA
ncbi:PucR family transcriptional regulator [Cryptosporangium aurantiacum]|uniref:PucR C-terminal helix-turn-helix domain-containing protein n=1 Tax=Cryptosporangium aurantiacum TaxID=134849 RepID=A0A1M7RK86_9ACTN|nr:helix-turn-helix domain-containing protein [Cryptosporangium aurantiacum]SHN46717.1 PucR C-terminal helix-turn-helix domain-containing protein [Cryptosporangium aurantiacum]